MRPRSRRFDPRLRALSFAVLSALPLLGAANPLDPVVQLGHATFSASGNMLTIANTPGTVIDWGGFSIGRGEITHFAQASAASQVLNRVVGGSPSEILGTLSSNGRVFLINPNGIAFGPGATVDVAGLVASSLNLTNQDFSAGRLNFAALSGQAGAIGIDKSAALRTATGGSIYLIAPSIENHGVIHAPNGSVVLAAGSRATLVDTYRPDVRVEIAAASDAAVNVGQIVGGHAGIYAGAIRNEGMVSATQATIGENGTIVFRAATISTAAGSTLTAAGGSIHLDAGVLNHAGIAAADGMSGGRVDVTAGTLIQSGRFSAAGTAGAGGNVDIRSQGALIQTADAVTSAAGRDSGGTVRAEGGSQSRVFTSGRLDAGSALGNGGTVHVLGNDIVLAGAAIEASGATGGGDIRVGGGARGQDPALRNAQSVYASATATLSADATRNGHGGSIVLWSDGDTRVGAILSARGGLLYGNGGHIEVSGKNTTQFGGSANAGAANGLAGTFLLDPKNIIIDDLTGGLSYRDLLDPNPNTDSTRGNGFGRELQIYGSNTLVTDPLDNAAGTRAGAIYLYRGSDGALLTTLTGAAAEDSVGTGHRVQIGQNLLLVHTLFGGGNGNEASAKGAVTWLNAATGKLANDSSTGAVSVANSLLGSFAGDRVNLSQDRVLVQPVAGRSGGYFLISESWNSARGAITWINSATGKLADGTAGGVISEANSLLGENPGDRVGYLQFAGFPFYTPRPIIEQVGSGFLVFNPYFGSGGTFENAKGAVTWIDPASGLLADGQTGGVVSGANSIVGANAGDRVGATGSARASLQSSGSRSLILSEHYDGGKGSVTWIDGNTGRLSDGTSTGAIVGAANSFVGSTAGDSTDARWIDTEDGFVYVLPEWNAGRGALTWIDMGTGRTAGGERAGTIGAATSIVGGTAGDRIADDVRELRSGHFVIVAPDWSDPNGDTRVGAVTWVSATGQLGNGALAGELSAATSLIGSAQNDRVGSHGILEPTSFSSSRSYLVVSREWGSGGDPGQAMGAVTWVDGRTGKLLNDRAGGVLDASNSLVGSRPGDRVGSNVIDANRNGDGVYRVSFGRHFLIASPDWNEQRGAATWINGDTGALANGTMAVGEVAAGNSLVGITPYRAPDPQNPYDPGTTGDHVGSYIDTLNSGHILVRSPDWGDTDLGAELGAATWINGTNGLLAGMTQASQFTALTSSVSSRNSVIGRNDHDAVGSGGIDDAGSYLLVLSPQVAADDPPDFHGAVTWIDANTGRLSNMAQAADFADLGGRISIANTVLDVGTPERIRMGSNARLLLNREWLQGTGALTWLGADGKLSNGSTGGIVTSANSLVGSSQGEGADMRVQALASGHAALFTPKWSAGGQKADAGAVTWINSFSGRLVGNTAGGTIGSHNSIVGASAGDAVGSDGLLEIGYSPSSRSYLIRSPNFSHGGLQRAGALTWFNANTGLLAGMTSDAEYDGTVHAGNSVLGAAEGDAYGDGQVTDVESLDYFGPDYRILISNSNALGGAGAVTWMRGRNGQLSDGSFGGILSASNSVVGESALDGVGSGGLYTIHRSTGINDFFIVSPNWSAGGDAPGAGAITWIRGADGKLANGQTGGVVSGANSVVGGSTGDNFGSGGIYAVGDDFYNRSFVVLSPNWNGGGATPGAGAATWIRGSDGSLVDGALAGVVSSTNSLVGAAAGDAIGSSGIRDIGGGKQLLLSPNWSDGGTKIGAGAITWLDGATGMLIAGRMTGTVSSANSLVGRAAGDQIGVGAIRNVGSSVLVFSPHWSDGGTKAQAGALTWIARDTGLFAAMTSAEGFDGAIGASNSLIGANAGDLAGGYATGFTFNPWDMRYQLIDGNRLLISSQHYFNRAGAITWMDASTGRLSDGTTGGRIGSANSLVGSRADDQVGNSGFGIQQTQDATGARNVLVLSPNWNSGTGAVTWISGATGRLIDGSTGGEISRGNSLVGGNAGDRIGQSFVTAFRSGVGSFYAFYSNSWNGNRGAVTWMNGGTGLLTNMTSAVGYDGLVSAANSLVGDAAGDRVASEGVQRLSGSSGRQFFVVRSSVWNGGRGAFTAIDAFTGKLIGGANGGSINAANSLIGGNAGDRIGEFGPQGTGEDGTYLLVSRQFGSQRGAVTLMDRNWTITGLVSEQNSVTGTNPNAGLLYQSSEGGIVTDFTQGNSLLRFRTDGTGRIVALSNRFVQGDSPPQLFGNSAGGDVTIRPQALEAMLNTGTQVLLQANNDIIVRKAVSATGTTTANGLLKMQAGRSIALNASLTNFNKDASGASILLIGNENEGVVAAQRDAGPAAITLASGVTVAGGGTLQMLVKNGSGTTDSGIFANANALISTLSGAINLTAPTIGMEGAPLRLAAVGSVSATSTVGGAFLQQPQGSANAGAYRITVPDSQPLLLSVPNGTLTLSRDLSRAGSVTLQAADVQLTDTSITSGGRVTINANSLMVQSRNESTVVGGAQGTVLNIGAGGVTVRGADQASSAGTSAVLGTNGLCTGTIEGDLIIAGGSAAGASAQLFGAPDIGSAASPLRIGGRVVMTTGTGEGAFARVAADLPETIYLSFPNLQSGGYTVDGVPVTSGQASGFYAGGAPAVLGQNLFITYAPRFVLADVLPVIAPLIITPRPALPPPPGDPDAEAKDDRGRGLPACR